MTTTIAEAPLVGASDLTAVEAMAIVADFFAREAERQRDPAPRSPRSRACWCEWPWTFEPAHCGKCGHDVE